MAKIALTIAGSDSGGGAGIQADLKTMSALGVYGASVITAVTAQNTRAVSAVHPIPVDVIGAQIDAVLSDLDVGAIKIGMLATTEVIEAVVQGIAAYSGPVILDPVMIAKSGDLLLARDAVRTLRERLLPRASLLTPNLPEAACLLDRMVAETPDEMAQQGHALCALGAGAVLMKGGHAGGDTCRDLLVQADGSARELVARRHPTGNTHGTGCTLSAAICAGLARGLALDEAVRAAHAYLQGAIARADSLQVGHGHGPVHHFHAVWNQ